MGLKNDIENGGNNGFFMTIFLLLSAPFYLNDLANIFVKDWRWWLFIDYLWVKLFPLGIICWLIVSKKIKPGELGIKSQSLGSFFTLFLLLTIAGTLIDQNAYAVLAKLPGYKPLGGMPRIESPGWDFADLTLGLFMVGVCEELVFRGFFYTFITRYTENKIAVVLFSSLAFGLIHWSLGLHAVIITSIIGGLLMSVYLKTRVVWPMVLAHFAINFIDFSGVVPKSIFQFF